MPSNAGLVDYLKSSGTGANKLDIIANLIEDLGDDASPIEIVGMLGAIGSPISKVTLNKVKVYFDLLDPEPEDTSDDLDEIANDPFDPDKVDGPKPKKKAKGKKKGKKK
ncbi:hypothetical protein LCGC14_0392440 [marine sediment metagenome]|uniref:Uncharacterized protein n=1 Tax=marine sediment metagenome TaxID=412755 RepID=A0A0F9SZF5_9ZZZZ